MGCGCGRVGFVYNVWSILIPIQTSSRVLTPILISRPQVLDGEQVDVQAVLVVSDARDAEATQQLQIRASICGDHEVASARHTPTPALYVYASPTHCPPASIPTPPYPQPPPTPTPPPPTTSP